LLIEGEKLIPDEATAFIGLNPTGTGLKDEIKKEQYAPVLENHWEYKIRELRYNLLDDAIKEFLDKIWPYRKPIVKYAKDHDLEVSLYAYIRQKEIAISYLICGCTLKRMSYFNLDFYMGVEDY